MAETCKIVDQASDFDILGQRCDFIFGNHGARVQRRNVKIGKRYGFGDLRNVRLFSHGIGPSGGEFS